MIRKITINAMLSILCGAALVVAYWASDRDTPSYYIASWVMERDLHPRGPITAHFILVRWRLCEKRIEPIIVQGTRFLLPVEIREAGPLGLDAFSLPAATLDTNLVPGPAEYVATFIWRCPYNLVQWFSPIRLEVRIPITIRAADDSAIIP